MTTSTLKWLDFSRDEQNRVAEIIRLFTQPESRDELGIGVVRDAFSNLMFPGVSVIQTRARYLLFVPWLFQRGVKLGRSGPQLAAWVERHERALVETIRNGGDQEGLIGRRAGVRVKILPSTIYWGALQQYGILRWPGAIEQITDVGARRTVTDDVATEQVERAAAVWDPLMPPWPHGFPNVEWLDFQLDDDERSWLRERIATSCDGALLAWLAVHQLTPGSSDGPWEEPWRAELPPPIKRIVHHAELFSLVMQGAAILYNVMLAQRCIELDIGRGAKEIDRHREMLDEWTSTLDDQRGGLDRWDVGDCWALVHGHMTGRTDRAERFVNDWIRLVRDGPLHEPGRERRAHALVAGREEEQKRGQARLVNERLLRQWGGQSGIGRFDFRWGQVRVMLRDLNGDGTDAGS